MKNSGLVERIVPGTKLFDSGYGSHIVRYEFVKNILISHRFKGALLDLGCGTGYGTAFLSDYLPEKITGIDISEQAITFAKKHYGNNRVNFYKMDSLNLEFPKNSYDAVVSLEAIEHVTNHLKFIKETKRVLVKNGLFIVSTPNKELVSGKSNKPKNPYHKQEFTLKEFKTMLIKHFSEVTIFGQYLNKRFTERKKMLLLLEKIIEEKNSIYLELIRKLLPKSVRRKIPDHIRKPLGTKIYNRGKDSNKILNDKLETLFLHPSQHDFAIDRFYLNKSEVFIALCR